MWIIDTGRRNTFSAAPTANCPPKLVVWDVRKGVLVRSHIFDNNVLAWQGNYVNDIAVDPDGLWAYMSDTGVNSRGEPGKLCTFITTLCAGLFLNRYKTYFPLFFKVKVQVLHYILELNWLP